MFFKNERIPNTEYLKSNRSPPKNFICKFSDQMRLGKFDPFLLLKNSRTIQYLLKTIHVFKYYSEITNGSNTEYK